MEPTTEKDEYGEDFTDRCNTEKLYISLLKEKIIKVFSAGYEEWKSEYNPTSTGLKYIDHMVGNVGWNQMDKWVKY